MYQNKKKGTSMKSIIYKSEGRGRINHGWLKAYHTFSFADYYNPEKVHFGMLRVLNNDTIEAGMGFGTHPHDNMEIITIPLAGELAHRDSMGNVHVISEGEVQVMTAGTGITHSEYNASDNKKTEIFQIWVFPREHGLTPNYDQKLFNHNSKLNELTTVVSPDGVDGSLIVQQDVWFNLGKYRQDESFEYTPRKKDNGLFIMVIEGEFKVNDIVLSRRDAIGLSDIEENSIKIEALKKDSRILIIDVPMR